MAALLRQAPRRKVGSIIIPKKRAAEEEPQPQPDARSTADPDKVESDMLLRLIPSTVSGVVHLRGFLKRWNLRYLRLKGNIILLYKLTKEMTPLDKPDVVIHLSEGYSIARRTDIKGGYAISLTPCPPSSHLGGNAATTTYFLLIPQHKGKVWIEAMKAAGRRYTTQDFRPIRPLGVGFFGQVVLVEGENSEVAMKIINKGLGGGTGEGYTPLKRLVGERAALQVLTGHPYISALHCAFQDDQAWYLCTDYYPGGDLYALAASRPFHRFPVEIVRVWAAQLVSAIECIHRGGIVHRDLKLENVLLDSKNHVRVVDFGFAVHWMDKQEPLLGFLAISKDNGRFYSHCGTPTYMAPEMIARKGHGPEVDWWALGVMIYELLFGFAPFPANPAAIYRGERELCRSILRDKPPFPGFLNFPAEALSLVQELLDKCWESRLGCLTRPRVWGPDNIQWSEIRCHPFFEGIDWRVVESGLCDPVIVPVTEPRTPCLPTKAQNSEHLRDSAPPKMRSLSYSMSVESIQSTVPGSSSASASAASAPAALGSAEPSTTHTEPSQTQSGENNSESSTKNGQNYQDQNNLPKNDHNHDTHNHTHNHTKHHIPHMAPGIGMPMMPTIIPQDNTHKQNDQQQQQGEHKPVHNHNSEQVRGANPTESFLQQIPAHQHQSLPQSQQSDLDNLPPRPLVGPPVVSRVAKWRQQLRLDGFSFYHTHYIAYRKPRPYEPPLAMLWSQPSPRTPDGHRRSVTQSRGGRALSVVQSVASYLLPSGLFSSAAPPTTAAATTTRPTPQSPSKILTSPKSPSKYRNLEEVELDEKQKRIMLDYGGHHSFHRLPASRKRATSAPPHIRHAHVPRRRFSLGDSC